MKARRASSGGLTHLVLLALVLGTMALPVVVRGQETPPWPPAMVLGAGMDSSPEIQDWLRLDRTWLARRPAHLLVMPATADSTDLTSWLQRAEATRRAAASDTLGSAATDESRPQPVRGHRDLLSELRDRWLERGHLAATITLENGDAERRLIVKPGPLYRLDAFEIMGDDFPGRSQLLDAWLPRPGDPFRSQDYADAAAGVVSACAERGFPFPVWVTRDLVIDPEMATVKVTAVLNAGMQAVVGRQRSNLPEGRGESFLIRAAGVPSGQPYRESDLWRGVHRLLQRDLYSHVDDPLVHLTTARDTIGILWRVEPMERPNRMAVVLGLSRKPEGGTRLSGQVDLNLPNLAGTGRSLAARWSDDGTDRSVFGFQYLEPLIFGTPLDTDISLNNEVQRGLYTKFTVANNWRLPVVDLWGMEIGLGWDRTTYPEGELERTTRLRGRVAILHNRGDRSRSGWAGMFAIETANRSTYLRPPDSEDEGETTTTTSQLGSQDTQRLLEGDVSGELWVSQTLSLAGRASFRQILTDEKPVPLAEQYRFGGAQTLRGYREQEFHGETAAYGGVELRLGRVRRSRVYTFVDVGYFQFSVLESDLDTEYLSSRDGYPYGFGFGLLTVAAPGRIDLAIGFPGDVDFETAKLHVSLLGSF